MKIFLRTILLLIIFDIIIYAQSPYTEKEQKLIKGVVDIWPYIGLEPIRSTEGYIDYDYIHESHKRESRLKTSFNSRVLYELSTIEIHMNTTIVADLKNGHFSMPNMYLSLGKSFHYDSIFSATPFATVSSKFDVYNKDNVSGSISMYDAGIETVTLTRILLSFRMKAVNDINGSTFMLLPSVADSEANFADVPHWYLPRVNNEMGFRTGIIGYYYEVSYSQGFSKDSNPLALLFKFHGDYLKAQFLYQYNNNNLSPDSFMKANYENTYYDKYNKTHHLVQLSAMGKLPLLDRQLWVNMLGEYTWRNNDAHYLRFELGVEWKMLNVAIRPLFYISSDNKYNSLNEKKDLFTFEYSAYVKFDPFYFGFQGATDGRYYIAMKALF